MKNIIISAFLSLCAVSCTSDWLEVKPETTTPMETGYDTQAKITKALVAAYAPLQWLDYGYNEFHPIQFVSDIMGDDYNGVGGSSEGDQPHLHLISKFRLTSEQSPIGLWNTLYSGVYRSNLVINNMDQVTVISDRDRERILAEAHALRAFYYHFLWKLWGNIPYYTVNPDGLEIPYLANQLSASEVYEKIMEDIDFAVSDNRLPMAVAVSKVGSFNLPAAYMLRANIVMLANDQGRYASVLDQMESIIGSGIYALTPDFANIWEDAGEWNSESIFEINYSDNPSNRTWDTPDSPGGTIYPTFIAPDSYIGNRFTREGYGFGPVSTKLYSSYDPRDQRRDATILDFATAQGESYNGRFDDTGLFNLKYIGRANGHSGFIGGEGAEMNFRNNLRVYRYAETLLIAAELILRTGGATAQAQNYLDQVRARAFRTTVEELYLNRVDATLDHILDECRWEFALEGHRFWDLLRFGKAEDMLAARGYTAGKRYLPISQSEIDRAEGTLTQNPY